MASLNLVTADIQPRKIEMRDGQELEEV
jgi:hypothetical protein